MDIIRQLQWRYATKKFDSSRRLSQDQLNILKQAFNLTATSYGLQILKLIIVTDPLIRKKLLPYTYNQLQIVEASHLLVICCQEDIDVTDVDHHFNTVKKVRGTPDSILTPYRNDLKTTIKKLTKQERLDWAYKQAYITIGNLMTVCAVESIDACPMEGFEPEGYDNVLQLRELKLRSVLLLPVGFRAKDDMFATLKKVRQPLNSVVVEI